ncbi:hypothetical protein H0H92_010310 [Tricholoma furcatifolium]|nr:hypothetical protein H0H92_010310 [Tricholoma furcatifolium]
MAQATAGSFVQVGQTLVSAMMMFLGNTEKIYILDKVEGNAAVVNGHPAWGAVWCVIEQFAGSDIASQQATVMDVSSNTFCASGYHLPNGSYAAFGGNSAIGRGGAAASAGTWDATYQDFDGGPSIRILNPCTNDDDWTSTNCQWFDNSAVLALQKRRWYSTAEALPDGTLVLIGGFVEGGYINRNTPDTTPVPAAAENTFEFYPNTGQGVQNMTFLYVTGGLNAYAHAFLLNSGNMLVQANVSTMIWNYTTNVENYLPNMPNNVVRVYPASGAVAMLPLTPANNWNPTVLFCGGNDMTDADWGNYSFPAINTWDYPASTDCQRLTPEPLDGSTPAYEQDDDMLEGRSMGQFIILPDGTMLVVNGALNGTAGYATSTGETFSYSDMPNGMSLAAGPVGTPALYNPNAPAGSRWSRPNFGTSNIARMYHSSAMLLPDGSVLIAGSNPNVDVNTSTIFPTQYEAEIFYPSYFAATTRPVPSGIPSTISYGGDPFDITIPPNSYSGSSNGAATNATAVLLRGGFTTHAMNMGQRYVQLNNTFTVQSDGTIVLHVAQAPNPYILQPGPALFFVTVNGVPSNGTMVIVGSGAVETQPTAPPSVLPPSVLLSSASGSASSSTTNNGSGSSGSSTSHLGEYIGIAAGGVAVVALALALGFFLRRRRGTQQASDSAYAMTAGGQIGSGYPQRTAGPFAGAPYGHESRGSDAGSFAPLHRPSESDTWNGSTVNLVQGPYRDEAFDPRASGGLSMHYDPYGSPRQAPQLGRRY